MEQQPTILPDIFVIGIFLMFGGSAYALGRYLRLPRVTLLVIVGLIVGPSIFNLVPTPILGMFPTVSYIALAMIAFRLGEGFADFELKKGGWSLILISLGKTIVAATLVFGVSYYIQHDLILSLLLAGLAPASAPAATLDVISETKAKGPLTNTIIGVLGFDNVGGIALFSSLLVVAETIGGAGEPTVEILLGLWKISGAFLLGFGLGWLMARIVGRLKPGKTTLLGITGFIIFCAGLSYVLGVSYLLACIAMGATVSKNRTQPYKPIFYTVEDVSEPFLVIFFLLAGSELELSALKSLGLVGILYVVARCLGFVIGGGIAARLVKAQPVVRDNIGWSLFPQAGVALGLAVITLEEFPVVGERLVSIIVSTTVVFELFGPTVTKWRLVKAGEAAEAVPTVQVEKPVFVQVRK